VEAYDSGVTEYDIIAREVSGYRTRVETIEKRLEDVEKVNARLEAAALTTARAMIEISQHWDAVYEAMRRPEAGAFSNEMKP
jgi:predicted nuclease with TOPRIM domain